MLEKQHHFIHLSHISQNCEKRKNTFSLPLTRRQLRRLLPILLAPTFFLDTLCRYIHQFWHPTLIRSNPIIILNSLCLRCTIVDAAHESCANSWCASRAQSAATSTILCGKLILMTVFTVSMVLLRCSRYWGEMLAPEVCLFFSTFFPMITSITPI